MAGKSLPWPSIGQTIGPKSTCGQLWPCYGKDLGQKLHCLSMDFHTLAPQQGWNGGQGWAIAHHLVKKNINIRHIHIT